MSSKKGRLTSKCKDGSYMPSGISRIAVVFKLAIVVRVYHDRQRERSLKKMDATRSRYFPKISQKDFFGNMNLSAKSFTTPLPLRWDIIYAWEVTIVRILTISFRQRWCTRGKGQQVLSDEGKWRKLCSVRYGSMPQSLLDGDSEIYLCWIWQGWSANMDLYAEKNDVRRSYSKNGEWQLGVKPYSKEPRYAWWNLCISPCRPLQGIW